MGSPSDGYGYGRQTHSRGHAPGSGGPASGGGRADRRRAASRKDDRSLIRRIFTWKKIVGTFFGLILLGMAAAVGLYWYVDVPDPNIDATQQSNVYKDVNGKTIANIGKTKREIVGLDKIPQKVQRAVVAAENKTFYKDPGVDIKGTTRGVLNTLMGKGKQGGSTITQQYVKNFYLTQDQTVSRKVQELVIALKVDRQTSKEEILAGYLNTSYFGRGVYGIQAAAQAYYGKDADKLTLSEGAYLAALLQAPNQYDFAIASDTGKKLAKQRWAYALDNMVEMGWLTQSERAEQEFVEPKKPTQAAGMQGQNGYFIEAAKNELARHLMEKEDLTAGQALAKIDQGGWTIQLNIDPKKQKALEKAVKQELTDKLDPKQRKVDAAVQAGAVSVDPKTGKIVAMYGGEDAIKHRNMAIQYDYQASSTFKPVILAAALEHGATAKNGSPEGQPITPNTIYDGDSETKVDFGGQTYAPPNEGKKDYGDVTVQRGMDKSINSVFAGLGADVGMDKVKETAEALGMREFEPHPAMTLGSMGASPLDMAGVFATFDAHGKKVTPSIIKKAEHKDGNYVPEPIGDQVISRETADTITSVLQGVTNDGTGATVLRGPYAGKYKAAGKTGTSDNNVSALFAGYTPELVTVVGVYGEAPEGGGGLKRPDGKPAESGNHVSLRGAGGEDTIHGSGFPSRIWAAYTLGALNGGSDARFELETDMGVGVAPPPTTAPPETQDPTTEPPKTQEPTTEPPSTDPTTEPPSADPTTDPPSSIDPTYEPPITLDPDPDDPGGDNGNGKPRD
ncbi:Membrane carboxypeptidase (penicillin-binding protein) [Streptomyces indicus]|uniref:Membrane carboxypeptidase (Penicillin-binding protein) n=2 Tax=Streptomyces indicus TaxID=417292 RepID=A0A1G9BFT6_9ACTN|nr:transglycosylase domain-containing protein [Streptomyces indicus]SDK38313.1 Membrane carboxypeptidase (penicillin-binding protein) [Streptomyces indicus]